MLESSDAEVYALHISDGLQGIERVLTGIGVFRCSVVPKLSIKQQVSPQEHNRLLVLAAFPKEGFTEVRFPAGTVLWHDDPSIGHAYRAEHDDPTSMTNERLFREGSCETWFVNGRCRFFSCGSSGLTTASRSHEIETSTPSQHASYYLSS